VLRRVENASIEYRYGWSAKRGHVRLRLGNEMYNLGRITLEGWSKIKTEQRTYPVKVLTEGERTYWHFQGRFYWENEDLDADEVHALLVSEQQRKRGRIERAQAMAAMGWQPQDQARRRDIIPDDVKQMVWMGMEGSACDVALRPSFSSTTSSCSRWVAAARLRTYKFSAARAIAGRAPA
jgi:hypothetical protein